MNDKIDQRLEQLKSEYESGQKMIADLDEKKAGLQATLLRISGAIQVLEELSSQSKEAEAMPQTSESPGLEPETVVVD